LLRALEEDVFEICAEKTPAPIRSIVAVMTQSVCSRRRGPPGTKAYATTQTCQDRDVVDEEADTKCGGRRMLYSGVEKSWCKSHQVNSKNQSPIVAGPVAVFCE
jgi:hypothetical protein